MVICAVDGRHFRGYINDKTYVASVISTFEGIGKCRTSSFHVNRAAESVDPGVTDREGFDRRFGAILERLREG